MKFTGERYIPDIEDKELQIEHIQRYQSVSELVRGKRVLDAACGEGYGSYILSQTASSVHGVDIDNSTIAEATEKYGNMNTKFLVSSIEKLPFDDQQFDVVISFETLEHVDETIQLRFLEEISRVLKHDGVLVISTPNKLHYSDNSQYKNPFHIKELYREEFTELLGRFFKHTHILSQRFEVVSVLDSVEGHHPYRNLNDPQEIQYEKYMIAVCSNLEIADSQFYSAKGYQGKYISIVDRINSLQNEVEERNDHIRLLDQELGFLRDQYSQMEQLLNDKKELLLEIQKYKEEVTAEKKKSSSLLTQIDEIYLQSNDVQSLNERLVSQNKSLEVTITNLKGHVDLLLEQERRLHNIYNSSGWNLLNSYYKIRDKMIPRDSRRRVLAKLIAKTVRNPKQMLGKLNKTNIKKLKYYLNSEEAKQLESRIDNYMERHTQEVNRPELQLYQNEDFQHIEFDQYNEPLVSIVIPVYNQWNYTYACLASIKDNTQGIAYEVILADDMSTDETVNASAHISNIQIVRDGHNRGFLLNCNNAAKYAKGKYIFFLNNDTNVQPGWLDSLVDLIEFDDSVGMVGSKLIYPDGRQQEAGGIIWNDASGWNYGRLGDPEQAEFNYVKEADYISGAAIMIRHDLWKRLGGFDERYVPAYFEDTDLAFEVRRLGYKVLFQPKSVIVHFEGISHGTDTNTGIKKYQLENKEKFMDKWKETLLTEHFDNAENVFWARDRSRTKKTVVIVDHYVPHFDKDAGGRCTYFYTKLMISMGFHVIFIGDNFYRHEPYTSNLQQLGVEVLYGNYYAKNINQWIKTNGQYIDYVYLNRPHISIKYIDVFKKYSDAKIIYFGHDLHYLRELRNYELTQNPSLLKSSEEWKEIEFKLFRLADVVHVVGSYEQKVLIDQLPDKKIRNIPLFPYEHVFGDQHAIVNYRVRKDLLFVGGFNHKPNYDGVIWFLNEVFPQVKRSIPEIRLHVVGSNPPDDIKERQNDSILVTGYVSDEELERYYESCSVVVVPLRFGAGVKGKVVEALQYQVPVVTTSIGAEGIFEADKVMIIADAPEQFANEVIDLYTDESKWNAYSATSGEYIKKFFTVKAAQDILALDMES
ncbi:glycosyltransferase [Paenibacillus shunpengii]|uniref:Glycosyltransferase n=1 Tax=Paenibacillus shunpengii TaxID=2054424 RepID=A0ABW5SV12_9BACL